jgi:hypothetical protein
MSLLTHDLEVRSAGSPGRDLLERLDDYCLDLLGTEGPLEFARVLQNPAPDIRQVLEELLEWTALDNDFLLIALVALSPELELIALRLSWGRPSKDTISEVLTQATVALRWTHELVEGERVEFVLAHALTKTRNEQRRMSRHNVPTTFIPDDYDRGEPEVESSNVSPPLLTRAVTNHVISEDDAELIQKTRGEKKAIEVLAIESGSTYDALRMRRTRAEDSLRHHFRATDLRP